MLRFPGRLISGALLLALAALVAVQFWFLVNVWYYVDHNPDVTVFMQQRLEQLHAKNPRVVLHHQWMPYNRVSIHLRRAIVAAEDAKFLDHDGFDWEGIQKAAEKNLKKGKIVAGGSTISQQLAKNLFLTGERTWWRKAEETAITVMIEVMMTKRRILEIYLNVIEWGSGVFGAEAAAQYHFGVSAAELTPAQAAELAAMVPNPRRYGAGDPDTPYLQKRTVLILSRMNDAEVP
ncbi:MAG TPA: monofunctional biosynthetic peptidoglycan transglycosylase [Burkholderiales bacterium]|nr:monofunctional biosynthetic peptidoglycan transglycosylase [Burkholderiales bacterium]